MATLDRDQLIAALTRLGEIAGAEGHALDLLCVGGSLMVLAFRARLSTRDLDVVILEPREAAIARGWALRVADEFGWPADWMNDGAKGFLVGPVEMTVLFAAPGITLRRPAIAQLLAMKLSAWRDDVDVDDAARLLQEMSGTRDEIWARVVPHLQPGRELKAQLAFEDLWESRHD
jgi:hypothetical protein